MVCIFCIACACANASSADSRREETHQIDDKEVEQENKALWKQNTMLKEDYKRLKEVTTSKVAFKESDGFFNDISHVDWMRIKDRFQSTPNCLRNCELRTGGGERMVSK